MVMELLIKKSADLNHIDPPSGETPLLTTARYGYWDCVKALVESGADVNVKTRLGSTAYMHAEKANNAEIMRLLKGAGAK